MSIPPRHRRDIKPSGDYSLRPESAALLEGIVSSQDLLELAAVLLEHVLEGVVAALLEDAVPMPCRGGPNLLADYRIARLVELARDVVGLAAGLARRIINSFLAVAAGAAQLLPLDIRPVLERSLAQLDDDAAARHAVGTFRGSMFPPRAFLRNR